MRKIKIIFIFTLSLIFFSSKNISAKENDNWINNNKKWSYVHNHKKVHGWNKIRGTWYWFDKNGVLYNKTKWEKHRGKWIYSNGIYGYKTHKWSKIKNTWYWFDSSTYLWNKKKWEKYKNHWMYSNVDKGYPTHKWFKINNMWYWFDSNAYFIDTNKIKTPLLVKETNKNTVKTTSINATNNISSTGNILHPVNFGQTGNIITKPSVHQSPISPRNQSSPKKSNGPKIWCTPNETKTKVSIVGIGDSYTRAYSPYGADGMNSHFDFLTDDLDNQGLLDRSNSTKEFSKTGEITAQTLQKLGVDPTQIKSKDLINNPGQMKLTSTETSSSRIQRNQEILKKANIVTITDNGNDLMDVIKILGYNIKQLPEIAKVLNVNPETINKSIQEVNMKMAREKLTIEELLKSNKPLIKFVAQIIDIAKNKDFTKLFTFGPNSDMINKSSLSNLSSAKNDPAVSFILNQVKNITDDESTLEDTIKKINPNVKIIHIGYPFPWEKIPGFSDFAKPIFKGFS